MRPHRRQPTRLPRSWGSPGKNTGVGCHFLLQRKKWKWSSSVLSTLSDPVDCNLLGSSVHGIFQARVLEWGAIAFSELRSKGGDKGPENCAIWSSCQQFGPEPPQVWAEAVEEPCSNGSGEPWWARGVNPRYHSTLLQTNRSLVEAVELFCQSKGRLASPAGLNPGWASEVEQSGVEWTEDEEEGVGGCIL